MKLAPHLVRRWRPQLAVQQQQPPGGSAQALKNMTAGAARGPWAPQHPPPQRGWRRARGQAPRLPPPPAARDGPPAGARRRAAAPRVWAAAARAAQVGPARQPGVVAAVAAAARAAQAGPERRPAVVVAAGRWWPAQGAGGRGGAGAPAAVGVRAAAAGPAAGCAPLWRLVRRWGAGTAASPLRRAGGGPPPGRRRCCVPGPSSAGASPAPHALHQQRRATVHRVPGGGAGNYCLCSSLYHVGRLF